MLEITKIACISRNFHEKNKHKYSEISEKVMNSQLFLRAKMLLLILLIFFSCWFSCFFLILIFLLFFKIFVVVFIVYFWYNCWLLYTVLYLYLYNLYNCSHGTVVIVVLLMSLLESVVDTSQNIGVVKCSTCIPKGSLGEMNKESRVVPFDWH
jgi:hypothetical protein